MTTLVSAIVVLALAILVDLIFGEPPLQIHPTVLMGKVIGAGSRVAIGWCPLWQRAYGTFLALGTIAIFAGTSYLILRAVLFIAEPVQILLGALLLKSTFSIRLMRSYALKLASAIQRGDLEEAKAVLPHIVRRDPTQLTEPQVISAGVESVAENTPDGITSSLFYYALFGVPGAVAYRVINTLDSMIGYKDPPFVHLGWFAAKLDSVANWIPARLTSTITIISAALLGLSASGAWRILRRDRNRTESWNAGWVMSAMAGALRIQLEKTGFYVLGDRNRELAAGRLVEATRIMALNTILFVLLVVLPVMLGVETLTRIISH